MCNYICFVVKLQWISLIRSHAEVIVDDDIIFPVFGLFCKVCLLQKIPFSFVNYDPSAVNYFFCVETLSFVHTLTHITHEHNILVTFSPNVLSLN